jgi:hypothetical protein
MKKLKELLLKFWFLIKDAWLFIKPVAPASKKQYPTVRDQLKQLWHKFFPAVKNLAAQPAQDIEDDYIEFLKKERVKRFKPSGSQPFIISIENSNDQPVNDVEVLNAVHRINLKDADKQGIEFSYGIPYFSYQDFLTHLLSYKYLIGMIRISFTTQTKDAKMDQFVFWLDEKEMQGNMHCAPVIPAIDTFQYHDSIYDAKVKFKLDCFSGLRFQTIPAKTVIRLYLYPKVRF